MQTQTRSRPGRPGEGRARLEALIAREQEQRGACLLTLKEMAAEIGVTPRYVSEMLGTLRAAGRLVEDYAPDGTRFIKLV